MLIDASQFPFVWLRMKAADDISTAAPYAEFEELLARKQAFVLLNDEGIEKPEHEHSQEEMKQASLWMKRHKSELRSFVKAMICAEPSATKRLAVKAFAVVYEKFWGYPVLMVATKDEALALARKLLLVEQMDAQAL